MPTTPPLNEYATAEHALKYLAKADKIAHRTEGERVLLDLLPRNAKRILDLGTGDGRILALVLLEHPEASAVAVDFSPTMLAEARKRFAANPRVEVVDHNLNAPLPELGTFDAVVSGFAIHHCEHERKRELYAEIHRCLRPDGSFCNLEHVASPTPRLHSRFYQFLGMSEAEEDPSNKLLDVHTQLEWLRQIGFDDVDCSWKWMELALLSGTKA